MIRLLTLFLAIFVAGPASAVLSSAELANAGVTPPANAALPPGRFIDQEGRPATIAPTETPIILLFADYTCAHLCGPGITLTAGALHDAGLAPGRDYRMIVIGLDQDGPAAARALIATHLAGLPQEARAIRLLTGNRATAAAAEAGLGYRAIYDPASDQFAHSAATYVFAPSGRLSRVLPETASTADMLRAALADARAGQSVPAGTLQQLVTLCYGFAAAHGVYGGAIVKMLRLIALATIGGLGLFLWRLSQKARAA